MFLTQVEKNLSKEFLEKGFVIKPAQNIKSLHEIRGYFIDRIKKYLKINKKITPENLLNNIHDIISSDELNNLRLYLINEVNSIGDFKYLYFESSKKILEIIVGNELAMQKKISLSIQIPKDDSSLLPVHSDTWSGLSPFEVVSWMPLVDCYKTKAMFILPPKDSNALNKELKNFSKKSSEDIFKKISKKIKWINIKFGEVLLFNQHLPHGNRINEEKETRWSMNCRFKSIFSPYCDKKIGEFYEPITLRAASKIGMNYQLPKIK